MLADSPLRRWWLRVSAALLLLLLLTFVIWRVALAHRVNQRMDAIAARGEPTTPVELDKWYGNPPGENPADALHKLNQLTVKDDDLVSRIPSLRGPDRPAGTRWSDDELDAARQYLALNQAALDAWDRRQPAPLRLKLAGNGFGDFIVAQGTLSRLSRLWELRAVIRAHDGDVDAAHHDVARLFDHAKAQASTPTLLGGMMALAAQSLAVSTIQEVAPIAPLQGDHLLDLQHRIEAMIDRQDNLWQSALISERVYNLEKLNSFRGISFVRLIGVVDYNALAILSTFDDELSQPVDQPIQTTSISGPLPLLAKGIMFPPAVVRSSHRYEKIKLIAARCGIAVMRFQQANGRLPKSLDELKPAFLSDVPIDPHTGAPLIYHRDEHGWVIYSVGADGIDHGGREKNAQGNPYQPGADIPFNSPGFQEAKFPR